VTQYDSVEGLLNATSPPGPARSPAAVDAAPVTRSAPGPSPMVFVGLSATAAACFLLLAVWVARRGDAFPRVDTAIHSWVVTHRSGGSLTAARAVTWGGVTGVVLPALVAIGALAAPDGTRLGRRLWAGALLAGVASIGVFVGLQVNALVGRARPPVADWAGTAGGHAFPSGHTTAATLFAVSLAWAATWRFGAGWPRRGLWIGSGVYAVAVGWSRIWLGVHWPTDVLGGWLFGLAWFTGATALVRLVRDRASRARPVRPTTPEPQ
jgi:membrane-associated phospholipid phosphatase